MKQYKHILKYYHKLLLKKLKYSDTLDYFCCYLAYLRILQLINSKTVVNIEAVSISLALNAYKEYKNSDKEEDKKINIELFWNMVKANIEKWSFYGSSI